MVITKCEIIACLDGRVSVSNQHLILTVYVYSYPMVFGPIPGKVLSEYDTARISDQVT